MKFLQLLDLIRYKNSCMTNTLKEDFNRKLENSYMYIKLKLLRVA